MIELRKVSKTYLLDRQEVKALRDVSLRIFKGEFACVVGPSGSGKSTLLHLVGCLETPTSGEVLFDGSAINSWPDRELSLLRRDKIGFVFQFFNLLPTLSAEENIALPYLIAGGRLGDVRDKVNRLLEMVGLSGRGRHKPNQLSGGELQRIAIGRAMINDPVVVIADEPTGNLDSANGAIILSLLKKISSSGTSCVLVATHDRPLAAAADRVIALKDGQLEFTAGNQGGSS